MAPPSSTHGPSVDQKAIPEASQKSVVPASVISSSSAAVSSSSPGLPLEDLYDYQKCTVMMVIQLRPPQQEGGPRPVLLSVQNGLGNKEDLPFYRLLASEDELRGPLPPALTALLEALQQDLPARRQRHEARTTKKKVGGGTTSNAVPKSGQTPTKHGGKQKTPTSHTATKSTPPPVPTATNPLPKEGIVFGGLFDGL